jgi:hypothetical protein
VPAKVIELPTDAFLEIPKCACLLDGAGLVPRTCLEDTIRSLACTEESDSLFFFAPASTFAPPAAAFAFPLSLRHSGTTLPASLPSGSGDARAPTPAGAKPVAGGRHGDLFLESDSDDDTEGCAPTPPPRAAPQPSPPPPPSLSAKPPAALSAPPPPPSEDAALAAECARQEELFSAMERDVDEAGACGELLCGECGDANVAFLETLRFACDTPAGSKRSRGSAN